MQAVARLPSHKPALPARVRLAYSTTARYRHNSAFRGNLVADGNSFKRVVVTKAGDGEIVPSPTPADATATPLAADAPAPAPAAAQPADDSAPEEVFYEGSGSNAELILSLILLPTLIYAPLSMASIGRRLWISFKFTNKRMVIINSSPFFKRTIEVAYKNIKEIRTGPRGFGLWGDMVVFLRDGSRLELTGLDKYKEITDYINRQIYTL